MSELDDALYDKEQLAKEIEKLKDRISDLEIELDNVNDDRCNAQSSADEAESELSNLNDECYEYKRMVRFLISDIEFQLRGIAEEDLTKAEKNINKLIQDFNS